MIRIIRRTNGPRSCVGWRRTRGTGESIVRAMMRIETMSGRHVASAIDMTVATVW